MRRGRCRPQQGRELTQLLGVGGLVLPDRGVQRLLVGGDELLLVAGLDGEVDAGQVAGLGAVRVGHGHRDPEYQTSKQEERQPTRRCDEASCGDERQPGGKYEWAPVGGGVIDWVGQFRAFKHLGYHYAVSLETHWRGAGTPEASTRISMAGLKKTLAKAGISC